MPHSHFHTRTVNYLQSMVILMLLALRLKPTLLSQLTHMSVKQTDVLSRTTSINVAHNACFVFNMKQKKYVCMYVFRVKMKQLVYC